MRAEPAARLAEPFRHVECLAHGQPDGLRLHPVGERLLCCPAAQAGEHEIPRHAGRVGIPEVFPHQPPEHRQPHWVRLTGQPPGTGHHAQS